MHALVSSSWRTKLFKLKHSKHLELEKEKCYVTHVRPYWFWGCKESGRHQFSVKTKGQLYRKKFRTLHSEFHTYSAREHNSNFQLLKFSHFCISFLNFKICLKVYFQRGDTNFFFISSFVNIYIMTMYANPSGCLPFFFPLLRGGAWPLVLMI